MSGPIVRKYGFPNFEKIFGDRGTEQGSANEPKPAAEVSEKKPEGPNPTTPSGKTDKKK